jgi:hypothetical protein
MTRDSDSPGFSTTSEAVIWCQASWRSAVDTCLSQAAKVTLMKPATGPSGEAPASHVMVIAAGFSDRWTSWKQDFFSDPARKRLDVRRAAAIRTFNRTNVDWKQHHHDGKESAGR